MPEKNYYPDNHSYLRKHLVTVTLPGGEQAQYVPRAAFETMAKERDELRRALAIVNVAYRLGIEHDLAHRELEKNRQTLAQAQATAGIIGGFRANDPVVVGS